MIGKLTFKQYMESKDRLYEATKLTPKQSRTYTVTRYCKFVVGESTTDRKQINLRPQSSITINWLYEDVHNPTAYKVTFTNSKDVNDNAPLVPAWTTHKIQSWLTRNTE